MRSMFDNMVVHAERNALSIRTKRLKRELDIKHTQARRLAFAQLVAEGVITRHVMHPDGSLQVI